ncbi:MAG: hypothetical protein HC905_18015 [Bacteroidales bacterium]|nr:hypothetical protein [Bacteroidales bacterium]
MKNKKFIYILLPLVLLVWGAIIYKVFLEGKDNNAVLAISKPKILTENSALQDTFTLFCDYRDPFLGQGASKSALSNSDRFKNKQSNSQNTVERLILQDIRFYGLISNAKDKKKIGLMKHQNKEILIREGEVLNNEIKILRLFTDSLVFSFQNRKQTVKRS